MPTTPIELDEAIKILNDRAMGKDHYSREKQLAATRLGTAGLEAIRFARNDGRWHPKALLPGEKPKES